MVLIRNIPEPVVLLALTSQDKSSLFRLPPNITKLFPQQLLGSVTVGLACAFPTGVCSSICAFLRSSNMNPAQLSLGSLLLPCSVMPTGSGLNSPATHCCLVPSSAGTQKVNSRSLEMRMLSVLIENQITTLTEPGRCNSCSVGLHPSTGGWRIS